MGGLLGRAGMSEQERIQREQDLIKSREIDEMNERDKEHDQKVSKLLLLGAGESGKSTLFKQVVTLWGDGYPEQERLKYVDPIHQNVIRCMMALCRACESLAEEYPETRIDEDLEEIRLRILDVDPVSDRVSIELIADWRLLEQDPGIQRAFELRAKFQLFDSAEYYFERLDSIIEADYVPTMDDVLRTRIKTTGIIQTDFAINGFRMQIFDVGGQRSERKKWMHCFEDVTAVLFVAAISEYDQVLEEDGITNRLDESLDLFNQICNNNWLRNTAMILFLNKSDIFREKLEKVPFSVYNEDYKDENDFDSVSKFIEDLFLQENENSNRRIFPHITCATQTDNVKVVFEAVRDIIIDQSLDRGGLSKY